MISAIKPSVLFVSDTATANAYSDPSTRYRCFNMSQELVRRGHRSHVVSQQLFERDDDQLAGFDRYVFHRPRLTLALADFLHALPPDHAVADLDDLIFDIQYAEVTSAVRACKRPAAQIRRHIAQVAESLRLVTVATASTAPLARHMRQFERLAISVVHNHVDPAFIGVARRLREKRTREARAFTFGYFAGTSIHDLDLELIVPTLVEVLAANPSFGLLLVGPAALPEALTPYTAQIRRTGKLSFHALPYAMARCQKVLAPLERTAFNESKSGLKCFEAALLGCEVIATPIPDIVRLRSPLLSTCTTADDWVRALAADRRLGPEEVEVAARELEAEVRIEAAVPSWMKAVRLENA